ncbi:hypothetical protein BCU68_09310 [Vibrio sp. 10N.286.49.B3]|uniref:6-hydroxymethylpterin diphosphokinase MptE-like protein n=1 Tax=Vibrio sp. 10N.286.49.B3 TaxID=1880855 RepID=UPI000C85272D|nr:6-hydroxymethylpterin diphosphokinase MptE-like protein [Vibrio sp. 10N.286.49.B3]PMH45982.1 hypothetical protein BCU68_09310 [Vibrio sp. 10N.286.49.B3]
MSSTLAIKIRRKLIKKYIKLTHDKADWYKADYWPDIKNIEDEYYFQKNLIPTQKLSTLQTEHDNVNIIGSGPSINKLDLAEIKNSANIYLNGAISIAHDKNLPVFAHVIMDFNFVYNRFDIIKNTKKGTNLILSLGALCAIAERDMDLLLSCNIFVFKTEKISASNLLSTDIDSFIVDGGSVMSIAVQIAYRMQAPMIYLLGLDISNATQPRFYENDKNKQKCGLQKDYENKILPFMMEAAKVAQANGIDIVNCSPISKLPFDIIPYSNQYEK